MKQFYSILLIGLFLASCRTENDPVSVTDPTGIFYLADNGVTILCPDA